MNVVKCINGHFFDGDSYTLCPHCGAAMNSDAAATANSSTFQNKKGRRSGLPWKKSAPSVPASQSTNSFVIPKGSSDGSSTTVVLPEEPPFEIPTSGVGPQKDVTLDFWDSPAPSKQENTSVVHVDDSSASSSESIADVIKTTPDNPVQDDKTINDADTPHPESLKAAIKNASATSEGKTMSYFSTAVEGSSEKEMTADPVVGWLVCIKGNHFGECFNISAGMNSIGRSETNRIILKKDPSISREKHALITYEPKKRNFYIKPGDSSGLTYVNDDYITETKPLSSRDIIEMGSSQFLFIPLCDQSFTWEDYITKE